VSLEGSGGEDQGEQQRLEQKRDRARASLLRTHVEVIVSATQPARGKADGGGAEFIPLDDSIADGRQRAYRSQVLRP
jgi:hypothetical protein